MAYLHERAILTVIFGIISAVLLKVILLRYEDSLVIEGIGIAMTMWLIPELNYQADLQMIVAAVIVGFTFGYFALPGKDGRPLGSLLRCPCRDHPSRLCSAAGPAVVPDHARLLHPRPEGQPSTNPIQSLNRIGQANGARAGTGNAFPTDDAAGWVSFGVFQQPIFVVMYVGCVATAAADTLASEIGVNRWNPAPHYDVRKVPIGTNGGITVPVKQ